MAGGGGAHEEGHPWTAMVWPFFALTVSLLTRQVLLWYPAFPYTALLLCLGIGLGALSVTPGLGLLGESSVQWAEISPELILYLFLPSLIFADGLQTNTHFFRKTLGSSLLLAVPGVLVGAALTAVVVKYVLPDDVGWSLAMVLGAIVSATDPVAVLALLKDVGADEKLATVVSGESLLNDGAAVVLFKLFLQFAMGCGCENDGWYIASFILRNTLAGPAIGAAFAIAALFWLARTRDPIVETVIILCVAYLSYITADGVALSSGVLAVVTGALILADLGRLSVTGEGEVMTKHTWHIIEYIANSLVFFLAGTIMGYHAASPNPGMGGRAYVGAYSVAWGLVLYLFVLLIRAVIIGLAFPYMSRTAYKWTWKEAVVLWWGGLRGAVGLSLALSLQETAERGMQTASTDDDIDQFVANRFLAYTSIITIMTLVLHGPTTKPLMKFINIIDEEKEVELNILMRQHLHHETIEYWKDHQRDPLLGIDAIREVVQRYVCFLDEDDSAAKFKYSAKSVAEARTRRPRGGKLSMTSLKTESESDAASEDASAVAATAAGPPPASEGDLRSGASSAKSLADTPSFPRSPTPVGWVEWAEKAGDTPGLHVGALEEDPDSYRDLTPRILTAMVDAGSRYLSAIKVQFWLLREAGLLSRTGALVLMNSVDRALDDLYAGANGPEELRVEHILTDWKHLGDLTFKEADLARYDPAARPVGQRLSALWGWVRKATAEVTGFLIGYNLGNDWRGAVPFSLELAYAYVHAHRKARQDLGEALPDDEALEESGRTASRPVRHMLTLLFRESEQAEKKAIREINNAIAVSPVALHTFICKRAVLKIIHHQIGIVEDMVLESAVSEKMGREILEELDKMRMDLLRKRHRFESDTTAALKNLLSDQYSGGESRGTSVWDSGRSQLAGPQHRMASNVRLALAAGLASTEQRLLRPREGQDFGDSSSRALGSTDTVVSAGASGRASQRWVGSRKA